MRSLRILTVACLASTVALAARAGAGERAPRTWYVEAGARAGGNGTVAHPFARLAAVQAASAGGDTIAVLPSSRALDGGIALKPRQRLIGAGPSVRSLGPTAAAPWLTNSTGEHLAGDAVRLADGATVANLRITDAARGAVYGRDVSGVRVTGLDVSGQNSSCTKGFLIPQFNAPTNLPGVGLPIPGGLQNGWAAVMVDAATRRNGTVRFDHITIHDATCGDGIDVRISGSASYQASITDNRIAHLSQGRKFTSLLAIGLQARDRGTLEATLDRNLETDLGNRIDLNAVQGADSEGVFINGVDRGRLDVTVRHNLYTNPRLLGGFSANGLEAVTMNDSARMWIHIADSRFTGSTGDVIEEGALGTNARIDMTLDRVVAQSSTGVGNTVVLPFNNGDCLLAGSLGAGNDIRLTVRDSVLRDCSGNGLSLGSNVVNGSGPTRNLHLVVDRSTITGNRGGNLGIRNFTRLDALSVSVAHTDLRGSSGFGSAFAAFAAEDLGRTSASVIDLGGGATGSVGDNCIAGHLLTADVVSYRVSARGNWWGRPGGPAPLSVLNVGGRLDSGAPLPAAPSCGA